MCTVLLPPGINPIAVKKYTGNSESHCALTEGVGSDVHERLYRSEPRLILFANTFCRSACEMFLMYAVTAVFNSLTLRRVMSYIYGAPILDVSRSHTTTQHSR